MIALEPETPAGLQCSAPRWYSHFERSRAAPLYSEKSKVKKMIWDNCTLSVLKPTCTRIATAASGWQYQICRWLRATRCLSWLLAVCSLFIQYPIAKVTYTITQQKTALDRSASEWHFESCRPHLATCWPWQPSVQLRRLTRQLTPSAITPIEWAVKLGKVKSQIDLQIFPVLHWESQFSMAMNYKQMQMTTDISPKAFNNPQSWSVSSQVKSQISAV